MSIPYRTQQKMKRLAIALLILLVVAVIVWGMWIIWLQRYVIYTRSEGAVIDFQQSETLPVGEMAVPSDTAPVEIYYNEGENKINVGLELTQLNGYYITGDDLEEDANGVLEQVQLLTANTPVMVDVKSIYGNFFYSTSTGRPTSDVVPVAAVDELIKIFRTRNLYAIARVPALRDMEFGLDHSANGMAVEEGYLWMDDDGTYWLDPKEEGTISYLMSIAKELQALGFHEVVFDEYYFPETEEVVFNGDKQQTLESTAKLLVDNCASNTFTVSFVNDGSWTMPEGRTRVFRKDVNNPVELLKVAETLSVENPSVNLVFITNNTDSRFDEYGVLRPLEQHR